MDPRRNAFDCGIDSGQPKTSFISCSCLRFSHKRDIYLATHKKIISTMTVINSKKKQYNIILFIIS